MSIKKLVDETGFAIQGVSAPISWNYTVGLQLLHHPELVISTLPLWTAGAYFWAAFYSIKIGFQFKPGQKLVNFMTDAQFVTIATDPKFFEDDFAQVRFFFEDIPGWSKPNEAIQLVLADKCGRFPWEQSYSHDKLPQRLFGQFTGVVETIDMEPILSRANRLAKLATRN